MKLNILLLMCLLSAYSAFAETATKNLAVEAAKSTKPTLSNKPLDISIPTPANLDASLPDLGDASQTVLTPRDEQAIAQQIMREVMVSDEVLQDVEVNDYVQGLGNRLAAASVDSQQRFTFFVVKDNSINAFAMPGGVIGVHTGLILANNNESELASVLGHEIGHVTQHHMARMLARQKTDVFKNIGGLALALLVARANPELAQGALISSSAAGVQRQLDYTREHEREADRVGLSLLDAAGFDARAMPAFFTTLQRGSRFTEGAAPSFLRTHPLTSERIADVSNRVETMPYKQIANSMAFDLVKAKLRANTGFTQTAIDQFEDNIKEHRFANEVAEHYGLAVAFLRKNNIAGASTQVDWLKTHASPNPMIENLIAQLAVARNNPQAAASQYAKSLALFPTHRALIYGYAEHFLALNQPDKAIQLVQEKQAIYPDDAQLFALLAKAYLAKNKQLLHFQAQAESFFRQYQLKRAIEQMQFATQAKDGDFYQRSIVESRLKELRRLQENEQLAEEGLK
jgi:predicted Zn-dependent protease